jgi:hypothetical protein
MISTVAALGDENLMTSLSQLQIKLHGLGDVVQLALAGDPRLDQEIQSLSPQKYFK